MDNSLLPIDLNGTVEVPQLIGEVTRPELQEDVHHPKPLLLSGSILTTLLEGLVALLGVVLEVIKGNALQTNLFVIRNEH